MRAYAETLLHCLGRHAPSIEVELVELEPRATKGSMHRRWRTFSQPYRARRLKQRPHVWHVLDGSRACLARHLAAPVVVTVHDIIPWLQDQGRFAGQPRLSAAARRWWRANAQAMRNASELVCDSASSARDVQVAFGIAAEACSVVSLPLRPQLAAAARPGEVSERQPWVLHVGNNAFYKNREGALRIFARMDPSIGARLVMAGPAPHGTLLSLAQSLGIASRVQWLSDPGDEELIDAYRSSSLLVFPSLYEGYGWPVLEAMALGLPVVCSDAGSLPELLGKGYRLYPAADEDAFARVAEELLRSPEVAVASSRAGLLRAAEFGEEKFGRAMADCYLRAIRSGPGARA